MEIKFKRLENFSGDLPLYATKGSAGFDVRSTIETTLPGGGGIQIPLGFAVEIPEGYELQCRSRSGLAKEGIFVTNSPGTVDSDYRGELKVLLSNLSNRAFSIQKGDRIAQLVLNKIEQAKIVEVEELSETERGEGGFGSTGNG